MTPRRRQLVNGAAELFAQRGFAAVSVQQIADSLGLTAGAIYRHVTSKDELLEEVIRDSVRSFDERLSAHGDLDVGGYIEEATEFGRLQPNAVATYMRERHRLEKPPADIATYEASARARWAEGVRQAVPGASEFDIEIRAHATQGVMGALCDPGRETATARARSAVLAGLTTMAKNPPGPRESLESEPRQWHAPVPRREQILDAAIVLFSERGFNGVSLAEVGEVMGIAGPAVYKHYATKLDILLAAYERGGALMTALWSKAAAEAGSAEDAAVRLVRGAVDLGFNNQALLTVGARESYWLPPDLAPMLARRRYALDELWSNVLRETTPELSQAQARVVTYCTSQLIYNVARNAVADSEGRDYVVDLACAFMWTTLSAAVGA